jgi:PAS domain
LEKLYRYWSSERKGRRMPSRADIDPLEIPVDIWPHTMLLDVLWHDGLPRFRYKRAGAVFWRASALEPTSRFIEEVLPETAGDRASVIDIYTQMATCQSALYSENIFALDGQVAPMVSQHMSLPLSTDGGTVDMALAGHVFEHRFLAIGPLRAYAVSMRSLSLCSLTELSGNGGGAPSAFMAEVPSLVCSTHRLQLRLLCRVQAGLRLEQARGSFRRRERPRSSASTELHRREDFVSRCVIGGERQEAGLEPSMRLGHRPGLRSTRSRGCCHRCDVRLAQFGTLVANFGEGPGIKGNVQDTQELQKSKK